ncbi:calmodulin-binding protein 25 [Momordica charantia]|uniref:Calmodulin-binding protein 25 n=1 Tax=Momordica charantia TaxID=3673 RepID=A0A6J1DER1_MOMCH|nr:calmodulin-binding protein 25 [Momordica charantia]
MASSDNLASVVNPWAFRSSFLDPWISDPFSRDSDALTTALHRSLAGADSQVITSFLDLIKSDAAPPSTPSVSGLSAGGAASEAETAPPRRQRGSVPPSGGKVSKRKSRASKRNHTTFITADAANFRQMVQQVTGVRFGSSQSQAQTAPILKPEPQRPGGRLPGAGALPTLDTSAFLLSHHQQSSGSGSEITGPGPLDFGPGLGIANGGPIGSGFDTFSTFPTLESWKAVM